MRHLCPALSWCLPYDEVTQQLLLKSDRGLEGCLREGVKDGSCFSNGCLDGLMLGTCGQFGGVGWEGLRGPSASGLACPYSLELPLQIIIENLDLL